MKFHAPSELYSTKLVEGMMPETEFPRISLLKLSEKGS
jgi:hypothetical protein